MDTLRQVYPEHSDHVLDAFLHQADGDVVLAMQLIEIDFGGRVDGLNGIATL